MTLVKICVIHQDSPLTVLFLLKNLVQNLFVALLMVEQCQNDFEVLATSGDDNPIFPYCIPLLVVVVVCRVSR